MHLVLRDPDVGGASGAQHVAAAAAAAAVASYCMTCCLAAAQQAAEVSECTAFNSFRRILVNTGLEPMQCNVGSRLSDCSMAFLLVTTRGHRRGLIYEISIYCLRDCDYMC